MRNILINIPSDMLALGLLGRKVDLRDEADCQRGIKEYLSPFIEARPDIVLLNVCYRRSAVDSDVFDTVLYDIVRDKDGNAVTDENGRVRKKNVSAVPRVSHRYFAAWVSSYRTLLSNGIDIFGRMSEKRHCRSAEGGCRSHRRQQICFCPR